MIVVDTNVLLTGFRAELKQHDTGRAWLCQQLDAGVELLVPNVVRVSFLRLATRVLGPFPAAPLTAAGEFLNYINASEPPSPSDLTTLALELCQRHRLSGDGSVDAWIAAHALALDIPLASFDRGFAKFAPSLRVIVPRASEAS